MVKIHIRALSKQSLCGHIIIYKEIDNNRPVVLVKIKAAGL